MKEGQIEFQGTYDDMANLEERLYIKLQEDVIAATESEQSDGLSGAELATEERHKLKKQVSRMKRDEISPGVIVKLSSVNKSLSSIEGMTTKRIYWPSWPFISLWFSSWSSSFFPHFPLQYSFSSSPAVRRCHSYFSAFSFRSRSSSFTFVWDINFVSP